METGLKAPWPSLRGAPAGLWFWLMQNLLLSALYFCLCLAGGVLLHWGLAKPCKAVIASMRPLATGEHEACGYERRVYHSTDPDMRKIVALALAAGLLGFAALMSGYGWIWWLAALALLGAVWLDVHSWERVSASASYVWFQRGLSGTVHQLDIENIRDLAVDEEDDPGLTLRNLIPGRRNTVCRLRLRLQDKRVVALPRTDAARGLPEVEAVANHVRLRKQQAADKNALAESAEQASRTARELRDVPSSIDREMAAELKRLRRKATAPDLPPAAGPGSDRLR